MSGVVRLIDMVFPGDTNHHGTLFGGVALAHMDKVAFLAASRHGRAPFVTAASEQIDFTAPALKGELIEATGRIVRAGTRSVDVEVELTAEALLSGARRLCTRGMFTLVAVKGPDTHLPLPPLDRHARGRARPRRRRSGCTRSTSASSAPASKSSTRFG